MMSKDEKKLDDLIRSRLELYSPEPPGRIWENIQAGISGKRRTSRLLYLRWASAAAMVLIAVVTGILINDSLQEKPHQIPLNTSGETFQSKSSQPESNSKFSTIQPISPATATFQKQRVSADASALLNVSGALSAEKGVEIIPTRKVISFPEVKMLSGVLKNNQLATKLSGIRNSINLNDILVVSRNESPDERKKWEVGICVSPAYSSYTSKYSDVYAGNMPYSGHQPHKDIGGGISVKYAISGRWRLESGVYYSRAGNESGNSSLKGYGASDNSSFAAADIKYYSTPVSNINGQIAMNSIAGVIRFSKTAQDAGLVKLSQSALNLNSAMLTSGDVSQIFDLMEVPLTLKYRIIDSQMEIDLAGGISTNLVVGNNVYMENSSGLENVGTTSNISTVNLSGVAGIGIKYRLGKNLFMSVEPRASYFLNSINHSGEVNFRPWRIGVFTGLNYEF